MNRQKQNLIMELVNRLESNEEWGKMLPAHSHLIAGLKALGWIKLEGNTKIGFIYTKKGITTDSEGNKIWEGNHFLKLEYDNGKPYGYRFIKERE